MMKISTLIIVCCLIVLLACKKDKEQGTKEHETVYGTVLFKGGDSTAILINKPDYLKSDFLCSPTIGMLSSYYPSCGSGVIITNLPGNLRTPGTKLKFSIWKIVSEPAIAHHPRIIEVNNAQEGW
ncbi:hypothetical protein [Paraflavitalea speifideaquila]|uniref:hypothetical protein n=1 Tax=Paraflavitalea speifideaquila TaxID=3076558 RepID=UPI0028EBBE14|nr:hypothetical protein [Paraflavitalea speifideiaquila]